MCGRQKIYTTAASRVLGAGYGLHCLSRERDPDAGKSSGHRGEIWRFKVWREVLSWQERFELRGLSEARDIGLETQLFSISHARKVDRISPKMKEMISTATRITGRYILPLPNKRYLQAHKETKRKREGK